MFFAAERGDFSIMLLGGVTSTRRLAVFGEDRYLQRRNLWLAADASFANREISVHRYLKGHQNISGGT